MELKIAPVREGTRAADIYMISHRLLFYERKAPACLPDLEDTPGAEVGLLFSFQGLLDQIQKKFLLADFPALPF